MVLFDRHYFSDYHAYDISDENRRRTIHQRIHGYFLNKIYPKPDLVIYLDAPGEVLFARKGEGSVEALERRRQDYFKLRDIVEHFIVVDATQPLEKVTEEVTKKIWDFYMSCIEKPVKVRNVSE
jgi:thymidylate kinase